MRTMISFLFKKISLIIFTFTLTHFFGCAWQRIENAPEYNVSEPIPIHVGIILEETPATSFYGPGIVGLWKEMQLFKNVTYPYRDGDTVDGLIKMKINGGWKGSGFGAGILIGLTLGLASPFIGPSINGTHDATTVLLKQKTEVVNYSLQVNTDAMWGLAASSGEVANKADNLQRRKLAIEIAKRFIADNALIKETFGK